MVTLCFACRDVTGNGTTILGNLLQYLNVIIQYRLVTIAIALPAEEALRIWLVQHFPVLTKLFAKSPTML